MTTKDKRCDTSKRTKGSVPVDDGVNFQEIDDRAFRGLLVVPFGQDASLDEELRIAWRAPKPRKLNSGHR